MYIPHPCKRLTDIFTRKPWQGVAPQDARFLFIGLDANYAADIEASPIFPKLLKYHDDGVSFWRKYGVHHPFLLPGYSGNGKFYHQSFADIGFKSKHASQVCFMELLDVPTTKSNLTTFDLDPAHLMYVNHAILNGNAQYIFICKTVAKLMYSTGLFTWLKKETIATEGPLGICYQTENKKVYSHLHLSN